ncbi:class I SAM-dependent methyltransferase [Melissococcus plutonius]|uniref:tRNA (mnm(5)s(2)U34)-methyltransferase n=1 Tax=Melissococcus plutonius TaxID=33970 RepID=UPI003EE7CC15
MLETALQYSHFLLNEIICPGDHVVDATMGNDNDTLFLAKLVGDKGKVYAFDIQKQALERTRQRLIENQVIQCTELFQQGHETIEQVLPIETTLSAAIFNLGYLPKSDKEIVTLPETTIQAIEQLLIRLKSKGRLLLVIYYGHSGGQEELKAVSYYCQQLPQEQFNVLSYQFINQKNQPPILFCIEKK